MCGAGTLECPWVETQDKECLSVPGNILVHVLVCWVRICHGVLCSWGILSVPVWALGVLLTCIRSVCLCPFEADHLVFFNIEAHCMCLPSLRKWAWVIPFQSCSLGFLHLSSVAPQPLPSPECLALPHILQIPKSPKQLPIFCHLHETHFFAG